MFSENSVDEKTLQKILDFRVSVFDSHKAIFKKICSKIEND
jgi:hypothetical protein